MVKGPVKGVLFLGGCVFVRYILKCAKRIVNGQSTTSDDW